MMPSVKTSGVAIGHSLGAEFREDRKIENRVRDCQPTTNGVGGEVHASDRTVEKIGRFKQLERRFPGLDLGTGTPHKPPSHDVRVQGAYEDGYPPQWNPASDEPLAQLRQHLLRLRRRPSTVDQPFGNRSDLVVGHRGRIDRFDIKAHTTCIVPVWGEIWRSR